MSKILIVGNILNDIYLRLDERREEAEVDQNGTKWINWGFNGSGHEFFGRKSVYSGAVVTLEVLEKFGISAEIYDKPQFVDTEDGSEETHERNINDTQAVNYRYILCAGDQISYLVPAEKHATVFEAEEIDEEFDWVFVDRSAIISRTMAVNLLNAIKKRTDVKLAVYAPKRVNDAAKMLLERADLIFADQAFEKNGFSGEICGIDEKGARLQGANVRFRLNKTDLYTHLTTYSIIAASVLGAKIRGKSKEDQLLMAKMNIENTKIDQSVPFDELEELVHEEKESAVNLEQMARQLVSGGKGILAADESGGSIHKKFEAMDIPDDYQHRRDYRNLFFTTEGLEKYVNGVILFDETARQCADDGRDFVSYLTAKGIVPGIKVDMGLANMPGSEEKYTLGLNGLPERLAEYYDMGLRFAKWRAAFEITDETPTKNAIIKNAEILAQYAADCQEAKIVPIVEPEVVFDGDYEISKCAGVTGIILKTLFEKLKEREVDLKATLLKVNMVIAGKKYVTQSTPAEVGGWTAKTLRTFVPEELAGVVFLSGGQTPEQATENLREVIKNGPFPWPVTFSFARALQGPALEAWKGDNANYDEAKKAFLERLVANTEALKKKA